MSMKISGGKMRLCGLLAVLLLAVPGLRTVAQSSAVGMVGMPERVPSQHAVPPLLLSQDHSSFSNDNVTEAQIGQRQIYLAEQKQMVKNAAKLVQLAAKLNTEVSSQHVSALTPAELREVAQIEKLARSVRTKMLEPVPSALFGPESTQR